MLNYLHQIAKIVIDRRSRKRFWGFRPVIICIIQASDDEDKFLFITPAAKPTAWMPPQEGIEPDENTNSAILRCLRTELGIQDNQLYIRRSVWLGDRKIPEQRGARDVPLSLFPMRGKAYYAALVRVPTSVEVNCNAAEIAKFEWMTTQEIEARLATNSERKIGLLNLSFQKLLNRNLTVPSDED